MFLDGHTDANGVLHNLSSQTILMRGHSTHVLRQGNLYGCAACLSLSVNIA
jgi:hypothetical protein